MKIRSTLNGGVAEVDDEFGKQLIEAGGWEAADGEKPAPVRKPRARKTVAAVEETKSEE